MIRRGGYRPLLCNYLGFWDDLPAKKKNNKRIWIQAVSVGELQSIHTLIRRLAEDKAIEIILTTTTSTGYTLAKEKYAKYCTAIRGFPLDFFLISYNVWKRVQPDMVILVDSELWPEHLHQAKKRDIPVLLINARLSDRSYQRYRHIRYFVKIILSAISAILTCSKKDQQRFLAIGMPPDKVPLTGNLKFDIPLEPILKKNELDSLKKECGFEDNDKNQPCPLILLGVSTWPGEEAALIACLERIEKEGIPCRLLLVPRHAERRQEIETLLKQQNRVFHFRSQSNKAPGSTCIYVADTTGELNIMTQMADIVFVGKSLPPNNGGQNPTEAAGFGKALLMGPHMRNFHEMAHSLLEAGGAYQVRNLDELKTKMLHLAINKQSRDILAKAAKNWHNSQKGATDKTLLHIYKYLQ